MIEPGIGTREYKIGMTLDELNLKESDILEVENRDIFDIYKTSNIWFFIVKKTGKLDQLSLFNLFDEKVLDKVGLGDTLDDVFSHFGKCAVNHKVHEPIKHHGIAFEMEKGSKAKSAVIETISVSDPYAYYGPV